MEGKLYWRRMSSIQFAPERAKTISQEYRQEHTMPMCLAFRSPCMIHKCQFIPPAFWLHFILLLVFSLFS